jgi:hypothetical protein
VTPVWWALAAGLAVYLAATRPHGWAAWAGAAVGLVTRQPGMAVGGMLTGLAYHEWQQFGRAARGADEDDALLETVLHTLDFTERTTGSLVAALEAALGVLRIRAADPAAAVQRLRQRWPHGVMERGGEGLLALVRYGGALEPVVQPMLAQLRQDRRWRWDLEAQLAGPRMTLWILSLAPWLVLAIFRLILPAFYSTLTGGPWGDPFLTWCGASALGLVWAAGRGGGPRA